MYIYIHRYRYHITLDHNIYNLQYMIYDLLLAHTPKIAFRLGSWASLGGEALGPLEAPGDLGFRV